MTKLNEMAKAYVPPTTKNISEVQRVPIDVEITQEEHTDSEGKTFKVNVVIIEGDKYRVPNSVLEGIKGILGKLPETKAIQVLKSGTGMNTRYQVIPVI
jgi:hypothetical protein